MYHDSAPLSIHLGELIVICSYKCMSYAVWYDFINVILAFGLCQAVKLLVHLPLVEQMSDRHQPHFGLRPTEQGCSIKNQPGKQFFIAYPTDKFFEGSSSLSTFRFVPLYIASMMAFL